MSGRESPAERAYRLRVEREQRQLEPVERRREVDIGFGTVCAVIVLLYVVAQVVWRVFFGGP
jgi:hypothetical protein